MRESKKKKIERKVRWESKKDKKQVKNRKEKEPGRDFLERRRKERRVKKMRGEMAP